MQKASGERLTCKNNSMCWTCFSADSVTQKYQWLVLSRKFSKSMFKEVLGILSSRYISFHLAVDMEWGKTCLPAEKVNDYPAEEMPGGDSRGQHGRFVRSKNWMAKPC